MSTWVNSVCYDGSDDDRKLTSKLKLVDEWMKIGFENFQCPLSVDIKKMDKIYFLNDLSEWGTRAHQWESLLDIQPFTVDTTLIGD